MAEESSSEQTDQLQSINHNEQVYNRSNFCCRCVKKVFSERTRVEIKQLISLALPAILSYVLYIGLQTVCVLFAGHLGELELAAVALGLSIVNVSGVAVGFGLGTALETFCSQAYGAKNYRLVGISLQRGVWIFGLSYFPIAALWLNVETILVHLHQDREVARLAQTFVDIFLVSIPFEFTFILLIKYLQSQEIMKPVFYVGFIGNVLHAGIQFVMRYVFNGGFSAVVWSTAMGYVLLAVLLWLYIVLRKLHVKTWEGWSFDSLMEWGPFVKLAVPGMFMTCLEFLGFEGGAFLMGTFSELDLAVHGLLSQTTYMLFMIPLGLSIAAGVRVGNMLGAGDTQAAKHVVKVSLSCAVFTSSIMSATVYFCRNIIGYAYTSERSILKLASSMFPILALLHIFDSIQGVCCGIVRGCGRQLIGVLLNFISYYLMGVPLGVCLAFLVDDLWGVKGFWWGLTFGLFAQGSLHSILLCSTNWDKQVQKARRRTGVEDTKQSNSYVTGGRDQLNGDSSHLILESSSNGDLDSNRRYSGSLSNISSSFSGRVGYKLANYELATPIEEENSVIVTNRFGRRASDLSPAEKKVLVVRRLIPLFVGLMLVTVSAVFRLTTTLPQHNVISYNATALRNNSLTLNFSVLTPPPSYSLYPVNQSLSPN